MNDTLESLKGQLEDISIKIAETQEKIEQRTTATGSSVERAEKSRKAREKLGIDERGNKTGGGLYGRLETVKKQNDEVQEELDRARNVSVSDTEKDKVFDIINYGIRIPGGGGQLEQLLRAFCVNLSNAKNPFDENYSDGQKRELIEGITGTWIDDDRSGNTPYTFSWFRKWWEIFSDYADNYVVYETPAEINKLKDTFTDKVKTLRGVRLGLKNKDIAAYIKKIKAETGYSKEDRAQAYLYNSNRKLKALVPYPVQAHILSSVAVGPDSYFLSSDFMHFMNVLFPEGSLDTNPLLVKGNTTTDYTLASNGPSWIKSVKFDNLAFLRWYKPKPNTNSLKNTDHVEHAWRDMMETLVVDYDNNSGVILEDNPIKLRVGNGFKGFAEAFHSVFRPDIQRKYIILRRLRSIPVGVNIYLGGSGTLANPASDSDYLIARKLVSIAFSPGELKVESTEAIEEEIEKEKKIFEENRPFENRSDEELQKLELALAEYSDAHAKLLAKVESAEIGDLNTTREKLKDTYVGYIKTNIDDKGNLKSDEKRPWRYFRSYLSLIDRLKKVEGYKADSDEKKAEDNARKFINKISPLYSNVSEFFSKKPEKDSFKDYIENFCNNKSNRKEAQELLGHLQIMDENIVLDQIHRTLLKELQKSGIAGQDLRNYLTRILGETYKGDFKELYANWSKTDYKKGNNFHELFSKYLTSSQFKSFLKEVLSRADGDVVKWLVDEKKNPKKVINGIRRFEIYNWMRLTKNQRKERGADENNKMLKVFEEYVDMNTFGKDIEQLSTMQGKGNFVEISSRDLIEEYKRLKEGVNQELADSLGVKDSSKVNEWASSSYNSKEKVDKLLSGARANESQFEENAKIKLSEALETKTVQEVAGLALRFDNKQLGITKDNVKQNNDEAKLRTLEENLDQLKDLGIISKEEEELKELVSSRIGELKKAPEKSIDTSGTTATTGGTTATTGGTTATTGGTTATTGGGQPNDAWLRINNPWMWATFLGLAAVIGGLIWYFWGSISGNKEETKEE